MLSGKLSKTVNQKIKKLKGNKYLLIYLASEKFVNYFLFRTALGDDIELIEEDESEHQLVDPQLQTSIQSKDSLAADVNNHSNAVQKNTEPKNQKIKR